MAGERRTPLGRWDTGRGGELTIAAGHIDDQRDRSRVSNATPMVAVGEYDLVLDTNRRTRSYAKNGSPVKRSLGACLAVTRGVSRCNAPLLRLLLATVTCAHLVFSVAAVSLLRSRPRSAGHSGAHFRSTPRRPTFVDTRGCRDFVEQRLRRFGGGGPRVKIGEQRERKTRRQNTKWVSYHETTRRRARRVTRRARVEVEEDCSRADRATARKTER